MVDYWIIEEMLKRERLKRRERPVVEIQIPVEPIEEEREAEVRRKDSGQGYVIVDYRV